MARAAPARCSAVPVPWRWRCCVRSPLGSSRAEAVHRSHSGVAVPAGSRVARHGVIGHLNSGTSIPASKVYSDAGIPQISPSATNPKFTRNGYKTTFRVVADDVHLGGTLGKYSVKDLKGRVIASNGPGSVSTYEIGKILENATYGWGYDAQSG